MELCVCMSPHECGLHIHYSSCQGLALVASPPLLKYLPTQLVGNPIIKILPDLHIQCHYARVFNGDLSSVGHREPMVLNYY